MRLLFVIGTVLLATAIAASPAAATVQAVYSPGSNSLVVSSDEGGDFITVTCSANTARVNGNAVPVDPLDPGAGSLACTTPGAIEVDAGPGADVIDFRGVVSADWPGLFQLVGEGGAGVDTLFGSPVDGGPVLGTLSGGPDGDVLVPGDETTVTGGTGDDRFVGFGAASTTYEGDEGSDEVAIDLSLGPPIDATLLPTPAGLAYSPTSGPDTTLNWASIERLDVALDDGAQHVDAFGFGGSVRVDGGGADTLTGGPLADELIGGAGDDLLEGVDGSDTLDGREGADTLRGGEDADTLDGGPGADQYSGGNGNDLLLARDSVADNGDCGAGHDTLIGDAIDVITGCEILDLPPVVDAPVDPPPPTPSPQPLPPPSTPPVVSPSLNPAAVKPGWKVRGSVTTITQLRVAQVAPGSVLELHCVGRKCPFTTIKRTSKARKGVIDGLALLGTRSHKRLRVGQTLEVRVIAAGFVGKVVRYTVRKGKQPKVTTLCLPAGKSKPQRC